MLEMVFLLICVQGKTGKTFRSRKDASLTLALNFH